MYIINTDNTGNVIKNKFCIRFVVINFEDNSKKMIAKNPKKKILILLILNELSFLDFKINNSEIVIKKVI